MFVAAENGHEPCLRALLAAGADVNTQDYHGWTALMKAADGGHVQIALRLLEAGADPTKDHDGWTASRVAVEKFQESARASWQSVWSAANDARNGFMPKRFRTAKGYSSAVRLVHMAIHLRALPRWSEESTGGGVRMRATGSVWFVA